MRVVAFSKSALRSLNRMPRNTAALIRTKIDQYAADPSSLANNVKSLKGQSGLLRLRVGEWRVILSDGGDVILIVRIGSRGSVYW